jgi:hypothetical protein
VVNEHISYLAERIGPRGSATPQEREAAEYTADYLAKLGFRVEIQPFEALSTFSWLYVLFYLWPLGAWLLRSPLLALAGTVLFLLDLNTIQIISRIFPKGKSQNVYAYNPGATGTPVVLVAHLDSSKAGLNFSPKMVKGFRTSFLLMVGSLLATPVLLWLSGTGLLPHWVALIPPAYLAFASVTLIHREIWNRYTHGANDNASGVAAVMAAAERLLAAHPELNLRVLLTGCEEAGTYGMSAFLNKHGAEHREAYFINLDNIGAGTLHYMSGEGMFPVFKSTPELLHACRKVAEQRADLKVRQGVYTLLSTDAMPALVRGYKAISFLSIDDEGLLPNWHWPTDTVENVDLGPVETAVDFVIDVVVLMSNHNKN